MIANAMRIKGGLEPLSSAESCVHCFEDQHFLLYIGLLALQRTQVIILRSTHMRNMYMKC